jgi:uncharacterized membrane protein YkvA (DUF1232 family)
MAELAAFVRGGAAKVTTRVAQGVYRKLPLLKVEFAEIHAPQYPHLVTQLQFLANVLEDFIDGKADDLPYVTVASVCYALIYAHRQMDLIPDSIRDYGKADDSAVVRVVLIEHENALADYAERIGRNWRTISVNP